LSLSGYDVSLGKPSPDDLIGVWGQSPTSWRGEAVADRTSAPVLRVEDAFLRSVLPGRDGEPPLGLHLDTRGVHFDPSKPSDLEMFLREDPLDDTALLNRARDAIEAIKHANLRKYNAFDLDLKVPDPGYVLVIDQTDGDASVTASRADRNTFLEMLFVAREEFPAARILIKTHPKTVQGHRAGNYRDTDLSNNVEFLSYPISPHALLNGAIAAYTVSSLFGFEALLAGHKPVVFSQPFYIGWGLTDDRMPLDRRQRTLTRAQLFAGAMILYPRWYDPFTDQLCDIEDVIKTLTASARAWRDDANGWVASGMRLWKRAPLQKVFGASRKMMFEDDPDKADTLAADTRRGRRILVPGQVEDDASIKCRTTDVSTNHALLLACRSANPAAVILYKPHPDVEAGLRTGTVTNAADVVLTKTSPIAALDAVDEVWTMTSTIGFEALMRGKSATCLGTPFYAGWGLTDDRDMPIERRNARATLAQLVHSVLIDYPRYFDPLSGLPCPAEVVVDRLENGTVPRPTRANRMLSKLQGVFASYAHMWR